MIMTIIPFILILFQVFYIKDSFENSWTLMIVPSLMAIVFWSWIWSIGSSISELENTFLMRKKLFNYSVFFNCFFLVFNFIFFALPLKVINSSSQMVYLICLIISISCTVYAIAFLSSLICRSELNGKISSNGIIITFLSILYHPFGVWFVQPRIIKIIENN